MGERQVVHERVEPDMTLAIIERRNGAYLIAFVGEEWEAARPYETFDAASSLKTAKRIVRDAVAKTGTHSGPFRWEQDRWVDRWDYVGTFIDRFDVWEDDGEDTDERG